MSETLVFTCLLLDNSSAKIHETHKFSIFFRKKLHLVCLAGCQIRHCVAEFLFIVKKSYFVTCLNYFVCLNVIKKEPPELLSKKCVLKNFAKFTGKHLCRSLSLNKVPSLWPETFLKTRLRQRYFSVNFVKILKTPFLQNSPRELFLLILLWTQRIKKQERIITILFMVDKLFYKNKYQSPLSTKKIIFLKYNFNITNNPSNIFPKLNVKSFLGLFC